MTAPTVPYAQHAPLTLPSFDRMTPREQAEHLVHDHGWEHDYFVAVPADHPFATLFDTDEKVVEAFVSGDDMSLIDEGYEWPSARSRATWHANDHAEYGDTADTVDAEGWPSRDPETGTSNVHWHRPFHAVNTGQEALT